MAELYCALDLNDLDQAVDLAARLEGAVDGVKLGLEFFSAFGPAGVERISAAGMPVFLDLKLHDIPNTVARAVTALLPLAPTIMTLHAAGGPAMLEAASAAAGTDGPRLVGVTVLTSLDDADLGRIGFAGGAGDSAAGLARLARESGLAGIVCSPHEASAIRAAQGPDFLLVVPGIRPAWASAGDQKRIMTPKDAVAAGADVLVIGRPITGAEDPAAAAARIRAELSE